MISPYESMARRARLQTALIRFMGVALLVTGLLSVPMPTYAAGLVSVCVYDNGGPGTLKHALNGFGTVMFMCSGIIEIPSEIVIPANTSLTLDGNGHNVQLSGKGTHRLFYVQHNAHLVLKKLSAFHGTAGWGGIVFNAGTTTIEDSRLSRGLADTAGGIIYTGPGSLLTVTNSVIEGGRAPLGGGIASENGEVTI